MVVLGHVSEEVSERELPALIINAFLREDCQATVAQVSDASSTHILNGEVVATGQDTKHSQAPRSKAGPGSPTTDP